jgi:hypothetical protein
VGGESNFNSNNSTNVETNLIKFLKMNRGPRWVLLMKKMGGGESRATVPLKDVIENNFILNIWIILVLRRIHEMNLCVQKTLNETVCSCGN